MNCNNVYCIKYNEDCEGNCAIWDAEDRIHCLPRIKFVKEIKVGKSGANSQNEEARQELDEDEKERVPYLRKITEYEGLGWYLIFRDGEFKTTEWECYVREELSDEGEVWKIESYE